MTKELILCSLLAVACAASAVNPRFVHQNRIVGGDEASPGDIPWIVLLEDTQYGPEGICGGAIYNREWILTTANCVEKRDRHDTKDLQVRAGEHELYVDEGTEQASKVIEVIRHPLYVKGPLVNDIALLRLETPLNYTDYVSSIPLPAYKKMESFGDALVAGWGEVYPFGDSARILRKVIVPIVPDSECTEALGPIVDSVLCAGYPEGGKDACRGDGGSPLVCDLDTSPYLCGLVSWGKSCAEPGLPGAYTQVSYFIDWIVKHTG